MLYFYLFFFGKTKKMEGSILDLAFEDLHDFIGNYQHST